MPKIVKIMQEKKLCELIEQFGFYDVYRSFITWDKKKFYMFQ